MDEISLNNLDDARDFIIKSVPLVVGASMANVKKSDSNGANALIGPKPAKRALRCDLNQMLDGYDCLKHGGELMAFEPVGLENF
jgi:hypothetical protein